MNELTDEVRQNVDDVLRVCQALIFRDIWKMTDADAVLKIFFIMRRVLSDDNDQNQYPNIASAAHMLRMADNPVDTLETMLSLGNQWRMES